MKQRNHAFDLLCGICIVRMITLHITQACGEENEDWWKCIMHWTFYFMSFFFFKAGYFNKTVSGDTKAFVLDKFKHLMVPYFVWGLIGNIVYFFFVLVVLPEANTFVKNVTWEHIWETSEFYGNAPCWFLLSFFIAYVVAHLIAKIPPLFSYKFRQRMVNVKIHWCILAFPFISFWLYDCDNPLWFSLNNVFMGIYLFYLGRIWHFAIGKMKTTNTIIVSVCMLLIFAYLNFFGEGGEYAMASNTWRGEPLPIMFDVTLALCGLSGLLLNVRLPRIPVLGYIGEHSMVFFVAHYPMLIFYKMLKSSFVRTLRGHWDDWIILMVVVFAICALLVPHIEKTPWLSGRFKKTQC